MTSLSHTSRTATPIAHTAKTATATAQPEADRAPGRSSTSQQRQTAEPQESTPARDAWTPPTTVPVLPAKARAPATARAPEPPAPRSGSGGHTTTEAELAELKAAANVGGVELDRLSRRNEQHARIAGLGTGWPLF